MTLTFPAIDIYLAALACLTCFGIGAAVGQAYGTKRGQATTERSTDR